MSDDTVVIYEFTLPEPYGDGTPQDLADALRDHADRRVDGPLLDFVAVAAADLIESQAATIERLRAERQHAETQLQVIHDRIDPAFDKHGSRHGLVHDIGAHLGISLREVPQ